MKLSHIATRSGRLSSFLKKELGLSTGLMNRLKWQEKLLVNGKPQHADYNVQIGDVLTAILDEPVPEYPTENLPITVLYEDAHILAVDKPAGMLIHPSAHRNTGTLANRVISYYHRTGQSCAFHPITRLDRDTFGIVLLAKNAHIHSIFTAMQEERKLQKVYHAAVYGAPAEESGVIDLPIARKPLPSLLREIREDGKPSVTQYRVLETDGICSKLALIPVTGRTHQLRLHCSHMGYPILGDPQYGNEESLAYSKERKIESQLLCAKRLTFPHPITGELMTISSQMDADIK